MTHRRYYKLDLLIFWCLGFITGALFCGVVATLLIIAGGGW